MKFKKNKRLILFYGISGLSLLLLILVLGLIFLLPLGKLSKDLITFEFDNENFHSCEKFNHTYDVYSLKISTDNAEFIHPKITASSNVNIRAYQNFDSFFEVIFSIKFGTSFTLEFTSDNYQTAMNSYLCEPYLQNATIEYTNLINRQGIHYNLNTEENRNIVYLLEDASYKEETILDGFATELKFIIKENDVETDKITLITGNSNIFIDNDTNTIMFLAEGNADVVLTATDGSGYTKTIKFRVNKIPTTQLMGLPTKIDLVYPNNITYQLQYTKYPAYSNYTNVEFVYDTNKLSINADGLVTSHKTDVAIIDVILNGISIKTILVTTTEDASPPPVTPIDSRYEFIYTQNLPECQFSEDTIVITMGSSVFVSTMLDVYFYDEDNTPQNLNAKITTTGDIFAGAPTIYSNQLVFSVINKGEGTITLTHNLYGVTKTLTVICQ